MFSPAAFFCRLIFLTVAGAAVMSKAVAVESVSLEHFRSSSTEVLTEGPPDGSLQIDLAAGVKGSPGAIVLPSSGKA